MNKNSHWLSLVIRTWDTSLDKQVTCIHNAWLHRTEDLAEPGEGIFIRRLDGEQLKRPGTSTQLVAKARPQEEKTRDQIIPPQYHKWKKVFSEQEARCLPEHQSWNISINLIRGDNHTIDCKVYLLTAAEKLKLDACNVMAGCSVLDVSRAEKGH